jgi:hypothetical protein
LVRQVSHRIWLSRPIRVAAAVLALAACGDDGTGDHFDVREPGKFVEWIAKHHPADSVTYSDGVLALEQQRHSTGNLVFAANAKMHVLLKAMQTAADHKDDLHTVLVTYKAEMFDKYHNSVGVKPVLAISFDVPECLKYSLANGSAFDMAECATLQVLHPVAGDAAGQYCEADARYSPKFCSGY